MGTHAGLIAKDKAGKAPWGGDTYKWAGNDDVLVQTGDIVDRGDDAADIYYLFKVLRKQAEKAGGQVINLLGNHELMNIDMDWRYVSKGDMAKYGGKKKRMKAWSKSGSTGKFVRSFPVAARVNNVVFVHAGIRS